MYKSASDDSEGQGKESEAKGKGKEREESRTFDLMGQYVRTGRQAAQWGRTT